MRLRATLAIVFVVPALSSAAVLAQRAPAASPAYRDPKLAVDARVADLLSRMTVAEKVAQLQSVNWEHTYIYDTKTRLFSPERARKLMPHGMGQITRPSDKHDAREATGMANALQKYLVEETRLGIPAILLTDLLRGEWGFRGVVVSDYFGVAELERGHHVVPDLATAGRIALEAGVDVELPEPEGYASLTADLAAGRIKQAALDQA